MLFGSNTVKMILMYFHIKIKKNFSAVILVLCTSTKVPYSTWGHKSIRHNLATKTTKIKVPISFLMLGLEGRI